MKKASKKRLCWNCEGSVTVDAETCPYCGVSVVPASLDTMSSGFMPSYKQGELSDGAIPKSPYSFAVQSESSEGIIEKDEDEIEEEHQAPHDEFQRTLLATVFLLTGSVFFIFGLALMLFSEQGMLTLQWDATLWFIYLLVALPMLLLGWKYLSNLESN